MAQEAGGKRAAGAVGGGGGNVLAREAVKLALWSEEGVGWGVEMTAGCDDSQIRSKSLQGKHCGFGFSR